MREVDIEKRLREKVNALDGARCAKFVSPGWAGVPDRIILLRGGVVWFVELKQPGKVARPLQRAAHELLRSLGFNVVVVDSYAGVDAVVEECRQRLEISNKIHELSEQRAKLWLDGVQQKAREVFEHGGSDGE